MTTHTSVSGLTVLGAGPNGPVAIVDDVDFDVPKGGVVALIGESGSGKTTVALSLMGYARHGCRIAAGRITVGDTTVLAPETAPLADLRGRRVAYVAQSAAAAFNPSRTLLSQVIEPALVHGVMDRAAAEAKAVDLFRALALPDPEGIGRRYPHQVSGGQLQRVLAAMALITDPELVILDEPTTALDVTTQVEVLKTFKQAVRARGATAVYVSHDLGVVAQVADGIVVLRHGKVVERGATDDLLNRPTQPYTRELVAAFRHGDGRKSEDMAPLAEPVLKAEGLEVAYGRNAPRVIHGVSLSVPPGGTVGIIGESGSGKSTLARAVAGLVEFGAGRVTLDGTALPPGLTARTREQLRRIQYVFQNADTALNPSHTVERILSRPLELYFDMDTVARKLRVAELLDMVRLPAALADRQSSELSGGQKQRVNLARALAAKPDVVLCDEVTSALDTVVGAAIVALLADLRRELGTAFVFISHDISMVRDICDEILVLYQGRAVETWRQGGGAVGGEHPYTALLSASVPELRTGWLEEVPPAPTLDAASTPASDLCAFLPRCSARVQGVCDRLAPPLRTTTGGTMLCHLEPGRLP